ncbi:unnamed protein product [Calicophoron daubneyi]|uniref:RNA helicase n=1 Tax=Calicophoron daubneyi TaxID=300641 RepID=A0AAV2T805_CALDB
MQEAHSGRLNPSAAEWKIFADQIAKISEGSDPLNDDGFGRAIRGRGSVAERSKDESAEEKGFSRAEVSYINKLLNSKLVESQELDIEILRSDESSPLHSAKTFQEMNLKEPLLRGVAAMGFYKPSAIQERALPSLISSSILGLTQKGRHTRTICRDTGCPLTSVD